MSFDALPADVLVKIASSLPLREVLRLRRVSNKYAKVLLRDELWTALYIRDFSGYKTIENNRDYKYSFSLYVIEYKNLEVIGRSLQRGPIGPMGIQGPVGVQGIVGPVHAGQPLIFNQRHIDMIKFGAAVVVIAVLVRIWG